MSTAIQQIQDGIEWHKNLLVILTETDYARGALREQNNYIAELERSLLDKRQQIHKLDEQREKELKEHESYRDSKVKKLAFRVSGKSEEFAARAEKEQQEYYQVLQDLKIAGDEEQDLQSRRTEALRVRNDLETQVSRNQQAQHDIEALYDSIFNVHGHLFPDAEQARFRHAEMAHDLEVMTQKVIADEKASQALTSATVSLKKASHHIESALDASRMDIMGGGSMTDYMERRSLDKAEAFIAEANTLVRQAQQISPQVELLPLVRIPGPSMGDIVFDNIFSDLDMHDKIKAAREQLRRSARALDVQLKESNNRRAFSESEQQLASNNCSMAKTDMLKIRRAVFERAAAGHLPPTVVPSPHSPPSSTPSYSSAAAAAAAPPPWSPSDPAAAAAAANPSPPVPTEKSNNPFLSHNQINSSGTSGAANGGGSSSSSSSSNTARTRSSSTRSYHHYDLAGGSGGGSSSSANVANSNGSDGNSRDEDEAPPPYSGPIGVGTNTNGV